MHLDDGEHLTPTGSIRAVGWLEINQAFPTGPIDAKAFEALEALIAEPMDLGFTSMGRHGCDLCQFKAEAFGNGVIYIPSPESFIYATPPLVTHYINAHHYQPPAEFIGAALSCPMPRTAAYRRALLTSGGKGILADMRHWASQLPPFQMVAPSD